MFPNYASLQQITLAARVYDFHLFSGNTIPDSVIKSIADRSSVSIRRCDFRDAVEKPRSLYRAVFNDYFGVFASKSLYILVGF